MTAITETEADALLKYFRHLANKAETTKHTERLDFRPDLQDDDFGITDAVRSLNAEGHTAVLYVDRWKARTSVAFFPSRDVERGIFSHKLGRKVIAAPWK